MTRIKIIIAAIVAALAGLATFGASKKRDGAKEAKQEAKEADYDKAIHKRRRVTAAQRVHDDDIQYRD